MRSARPTRFVPRVAMRGTSFIAAEPLVVIVFSRRRTPLGALERAWCKSRRRSTQVETSTTQRSANMNQAIYGYCLCLADSRDSKHSTGYKDGSDSGVFSVARAILHTPVHGARERETEREGERERRNLNHSRISPADPASNDL